MPAFLRIGWKHQANLAISESSGDPSSFQGNASIQSVSAKAPSSISMIGILQEALIQLARKELVIVTPYFAPDQKTTELIVNAVKRGVRVQIMIPGPHIDKSYMRLAGAEEIEILRAVGASIYIYQRTMLHQKLYIVDNVVACVGSANFNQRSIGKDSEYVINIIDDDIISTLRADFENDLQYCELTSAKKLQSRSVLTRLREYLVRLVRFEL